MKRKGAFMTVCGLALLLTGMIGNLDAEDRRVELVLDASGSMMGRLPSGELKIEAAKQAVDKLMGCLAGDLELAFRVYGNQSPRDKKDCQDTQLLASFTPLADNRDKVRAALPGIRAQGFTPITWVLGLAAADFPDEKKENVIILVSDGRETCKGDPCLLARQLKENHARLVIHAVGLGVDAATRGQLECIATATGGKYFDVAEMSVLGANLVEAANTPGEAPQKYVPGPGKLQVLGADIHGHQVIDAATGLPMDVHISHVQETVSLPAGIYHVTVAGGVWKSVPVLAGQTTVLRPGWLSVAGASFQGHKVLEAETGIEHGMISSSHSSISLMPGDYLVNFGGTQWAARVTAGEKTMLKPGIVAVIGAHYQGHAIRLPDGTQAGSVSNTASSMPLPPGEYIIEIDGQAIPFTLKAEERKTFQR